MSTASPPERRPLSVRDQAWARAAASWLTRRGATPNAISLAGMFAALLAGAALAATVLSAFIPAGWTVWPGYGVLPLALLVILAGGAVTVVRRLARITAALRRVKS